MVTNNREVEQLCDLTKYGTMVFATHLVPGALRYHILLRNPMDLMSFIYCFGGHVSSLILSSACMNDLNAPRIRGDAFRCALLLSNDLRLDGSEKILVHSIVFVAKYSTCHRDALAIGQPQLFWSTLWTASRLRAPPRLEGYIQKLLEHRAKVHEKEKVVRVIPLL